ncbi:hypothetical protein BC332_33418 [Capsicum chinense]|nr:hypothetical protein BC332_33418 [Capsicum chinense]
MWNDNYKEWDDLRNIFVQGDIGSKIIVTTRKESVALMMGSGAINVGTLSDEASWALFRRHSLENRDPMEHPELEEVGKNCSQVQRTALSSEDALWLVTLRIRDHPFRKEQVIHLWIANGLVVPRGDERIQDLGNQFFLELRSRSLFVLVPDPFQGNTEEFLILDLVNDLAQIASSKLCVSNCKDCFSLPAPGQLPCLKSLSIRGMHRITEVTEEFYGSLSSKKPFNSLEKLEIAEMPKWKQWHIPGNGEFPTLKKLSISKCPEFGDTVYKSLKLLVLLRELVIHHNGSDKVIVGGENWVLRCSIQSLEIGNLKTLSSQLLKSLTSLEYLYTDNLPQIQSLLEEGLLSSLSELHLNRHDELPSIPTEESGKQRLREARIQAVDFLILLLAGLCLGTLAEVSDETFGFMGYLYTVIAIRKFKTSEQCIYFRLFIFKRIDDLKTVD